MKGLLGLGFAVAAGASADALVELASGSAPSCKSDSGSNVDFAYSFKYPGGFEYAYMDSHHKLSKSKHTLDSDSSSISKTLDQMHSAGASYVVWNDQPAPKGASAKPRAHSKGVLIFTKAGGIWLTHSLPVFPVPGAKQGAKLWADASPKFGQTFLCITLTKAEIHKLAPVMEITRPVVYDHKFAKGADKDFADVSDWAVDKKWNKKDMTTHVTIKSKGGQTFEWFAKSGNWGTRKDLYEHLVAPKLGDLQVEAWRRGAGVWGPACGKSKVLDITEVSFPGKDWGVMNDHSKWALTKSGKHFCVGDINRAKGQDHRGGGTVCIANANFHGQMQKIIQTTDKCGKEEVVLV